ncbi:Oidioi.mRNA.OKI2018_I69.PAR.g13236.t1.cds [Oikopleura dioica]|uniref:Oidioi.mRNA.OKI2018_I69.PAR.g13236.t1.cds n=1 Tax=Oikopleura dioica TaxID=34765 RepID=A0ABN7S7T4_OIKDI|nr:Oidioi.mRNA.OKI2018_I69.PAR.g13236.t1.cds [Oikopleura dioica]
MFRPAFFELLQIPANSVTDAVDALIEPLTKMLEYFVHVSSNSSGNLQIFSETYQILMRQIEVKEYLTDSVVGTLESLAKLLPESARGEAELIAKWAKVANIVFGFEIHFYGVLSEASLPPNYKFDYKLMELTGIFFNETTSRNIAEFIPDLIDYSPKLSALFLPAALAGSPGVGFFTDDGDYWPVLACESDKACSIWKIAQKPGFEDSRAARLTCDLSINKCVCADGFVDKNNDPMDGCEEKAGAGSDGESCYFGTCSDDASCESFQPGLRCGSNGCCECDPSSIS